MKSTTSTSSNRPGLNDLSKVELSGAVLMKMRFAQLLNAGSTAWQARKVAELRDVLAIEQIGGPIKVLAADLSGDLKITVEMRMPVPRRPTEESGLRLADHAVLGLLYTFEATRQPQPGTSFVYILDPGDVWHPNVSSGNLPVQVLCLGPSVPAGFPLKHILLLTYASLTMMAAQFDELDPAGVLNREAAQWWQRNAHLLPLSREPFLKTTQARKVAT